MASMRLARIGIAATAVTTLSVFVPSVSPAVEAAPTVPTLVADVNTHPAGSYPHHLTVVGTKLFFAADDGVHGEELWVTDGVSAPTMVKDINPLGDASITATASFGGLLYFSASDGANGRELWKSDGTAPGTVMVEDIRNGPGSSSPTLFVAFDGALFFVATGTDELGNSVGQELFRTDGTTTGTLLAEDLRPGPSSSSIGGLVVVDYGAAGERLWAIANTDANSNKELVGIDGGLSPDPNVTLLSNLSAVEMEPLGQELYVRTGATLQRVSMTATGPPSTFANMAMSGPTGYSLTALGITLFLVATDPTAGGELHKLVGNTVTLVADINPTGSSSPDHLTAAGSLLYFTASDGVNGYELWSSNGTTVGTSMVEDIDPTGDSSPLDLKWAGVSTALVFSADDGTSGREPWTVIAGDAFRLGDIYAGATSSSPGEIVRLGNYAYTSAESGSAGHELFRTSVNPVPVAGVENFTLFADVLSGTESSDPWYVVPVGSKVFFSGSNRAVGDEPFVFDPATGTTTLLKDVNPGDGGSNPSDPVALGAKTLFFADDNTNGYEPWVTDGTPAGTAVLKDIAPGIGSSDPIGLFVFGGFAYFSADDRSNGAELWRTDGTTAGTTLVKDLRSGSLGSSPTQFAAVNGKLYFGADAGSGRELWTTDGTSAGTVTVTSGVDRPLGIYWTRAVGTKLVFTANNALFDNVLWTSDGTDAGTVELELAAGPKALNASTLTVSGSRGFFLADDGDSSNTVLWTTDGTGVGTIPLQIAPVSFDPYDFEIEPLTGGRVVLSAGTAATGLEPWISDGTVSGTRLLSDLFVGSGASNPAMFTALNDAVYFAAADATTGTELWRTDGTNTTRITDLIPGAGHGMPIAGNDAYTAAVGDRLFFSGTTAAHGTELWQLTDAPPAPAAPTGVTAVAGIRQATVSWTAPTNPLNAPVTGYTVTATPGGATCATATTTCTVAGLTPGQPHSFTVTATNRIGTSPASAPSNAVTPLDDAPPPPPPTPAMVPLTPARLLDTRNGPDDQTIDGQFQAIGQLLAGQTLELTVTNRGNVPNTATAVMLNVTAVGPNADGFLTVYPCGDTRPLASSVNYVRNQVVPNAVLAKIGTNGTNGTNGKVCIYTLATTHLVADVNGYL